MAHASRSFDRGVIGPVRREIDRLDATGDADSITAALRAKTYLSTAYRTMEGSGDLSAALVFVNAAKEEVGLLPRGVAAEQVARMAEAGFCLAPASDPQPMAAPALIASGVSAPDLHEVARHEATHAAIALFCGCRLDSVVARPDGSGSCIWFNKKDPDRGAHNQLMVAYSAYRRSQLCGRDTDGCSGDLERVAEAVSRRTGQTVTAENVLQTREVMETEQLLDRLLVERLGGIINTFAEVIFCASPNAVSGETLTKLFAEWEQGADPWRAAWEW